MKLVLIFLILSSYSISQSLIKGFEKSHLSFQNGLCGVQKNGKWGFVDTNNTLVINTIYDEVGYFINCSKLTCVVKDGKLGMIDNKGNVIIDIIYDNSDNTYIRTDCTDKNANLIYVEKNGKAGLINNKGKIIIDPNLGYDEIGELESVSEQSWDATFFRNGYCAVKKNNKWGFVDSTGKEIIACKYEHVQPISKKKFAFEIDNKWGIKNLEERIIIPNIYDVIEGSVEKGYFVKNLCKVGEFTTPNDLTDMKWGYIDSLNNIILPIKYGSISTPNSKNNFLVFEEHKGCYCVNKLGKKINNLTFNDFSEFEDNLAKVGVGDNWKNMKYGLLDLDCNLKVPTLYRDIYYSDEEKKLVDLLNYYEIECEEITYESVIEINENENFLLSMDQKAKLSKNGILEPKTRLFIPVCNNQYKESKLDIDNDLSLDGKPQKNLNSSSLGSISPDLIKFENRGVIEKVFFGIYPTNENLFSLVYRPGNYQGGYERANSYILKSELSTLKNEKLCLSGQRTEYPCYESLQCFRNNSQLNQTNILYRFSNETIYRSVFERSFDLINSEIKDKEYKLDNQFELNLNGNIETFSILYNGYCLGNGVGAFLAKSSLDGYTYLFIHNFKSKDNILKINKIPNNFDFFENNKKNNLRILSIHSVFQNDQFYYVFLEGIGKVLPVHIKKSDLISKNKYGNVMDIGSEKPIPGTNDFESDSGIFYLPYSQGLVNYYNTHIVSAQNKWEYFMCIDIYSSDLSKVNSIRIENEKIIKWIYEYQNFLIIVGSTKNKGYLGFSNPWVRVINKNNNQITYEKVIAQKNAEFDYITSDGNGNIILGVGSICCQGLDTDQTFVPKIIIDRLDNSGRFENELFH